MIHAAGPTVELERIAFEELMEAVRSADDAQTETTLDKMLSETRERIVLLYGLDGFECITGESLTVFVGESWPDEMGIEFPAEWCIGFYSAALVVQPYGPPLLLTGVYAEPLADDVASALCYLRSQGYSAEHLQYRGPCEDGDLDIWEVC